MHSDNKKTSAMFYGLPRVNDYELLNNTELPQSGASLVRQYKSMILNPAIASSLEFYSESLAASIITIDYEDTNASDQEKLLLQSLEEGVFESIKTILKNKSENYFLYGINIFHFNIVPYGSFVLPHKFKQIQPETITIIRDRNGDISQIIQKLQNGEETNIDVNRMLLLFRNASSFAINGMSLFAKVYYNYKNCMLAIRSIPDLISEVKNGVMIGVTGMIDEDALKSFTSDFDSYVTNKGCKPSLIAMEGEGDIKFYNPPSTTIQDMLSIEKSETQKIYNYLLISQNNIAQGEGGSYAAGEVLFDQFKMIFNGVLKGISDQLNEFIKDTVLTNNASYTGRIPKISISPVVTAQSIIGMIGAMKNAGINIEKYDIDKVISELTQFQLKESTQGEVMPKEVIPIDTNITTENEDNSDSIENFPLTKKEIDELNTKTIEFSADTNATDSGAVPTPKPKKGAFTPKRELTEAEKNISNIEKYSEEATKWADKFAKSLHKTTIDTLKKDLKGATTYEEVKKGIDSFDREKIKDVLKKAIPKLAEISFQSVNSDYKKQKGEDVDNTKLKAFSSSMGFEGLKEWIAPNSIILDSYLDFENWASDNIDSYSDMISDRIEAELREELRKSKYNKVETATAIDNIINMIESQVGASYLKEAEKIGGELVGAFRQESLGNMEVEALIRTAIYDNNTCGHCRRLDNQIYYYIPSGGLYIADDGSEAVDLPDIQGCEGGIRCRCFYLYKFA